MSGASAMTRRARIPPVVRAYLVVGAFIAVATTFNIFTTIDNAGDYGQVLAPWKPAIWEYTSGVATLLSSAIVYWAIRIAPPGTSSWPRFAAVHAVASLAFSSLHILLMIAMRVAVYASVGRHYPSDQANFWYEYRKDLLAYAIIATIFLLFTREKGRKAIESRGPRMIDIKDGKRLLRLPVDDIHAVRAAGNYVEFVLSDDRRPLVRQSLSAAQRELGDDFLRIHRSWAINVAHVRELRAMGAGDYEVQLACGLKAPLSRRFPDALSRLRSPRHG